MFLRLLIVLALFGYSSISFAATLNISPATGVYGSGSTFTVRVSVDTKGAAINAADGTITFDNKALQVVSVSRSSSIFNLWTTEPAFSNSAGTISFSGGTPTGYTGGSGTVMTITFRTLGSGSARVNFGSGSVLAADGRGTNVLSSMGSGAYTISAASETPEPEAIVEFVPPANTPAAPKITSDTHGDPAGWSKETTAVLRWTLPSDVVAVRTALDESPTAIPTKVYDSPIKEITLTDLEEGVSYFHIQFKNDEGWGKVTHYRLAVDTTAPQNVVLSLKPDSNLANPTQIIVASTTDTNGSPIKSFMVQLNGAAPVEYKNEDGKNEIKLENLTPGRQTLVVEVVDAAGNSTVSTFTFEIESFEAPRFTDVPAEISTGVIPVFMGTTRPNATVAITLTNSGQEPARYEVKSDETGSFRFIPNSALTEGVYTLTASAKDEFGAQSSVSDPIQFVVQPMGLLRIGSFLIDVLSVIIPLVALLALTVLLCLYFLARYRRFRILLNRESSEVGVALHSQFLAIEALLRNHEADIVRSRKSGKLTTTEEALITDVRDVLKSAERIVQKEVSDVTKLTD
ncbi:MAG: Ig-like domain-containing protein [Candidatus Paceibacteria bacterium]